MAQGRDEEIEVIVKEGKHHPAEPRGLREFLKKLLAEADVPARKYTFFLGLAVKGTATRQTKTVGGFKYEPQHNSISFWVQAGSNNQNRLVYLYVPREKDPYEFLATLQAGARLLGR